MEQKLHTFAESHNFEQPWLSATDPEINQHLILYFFLGTELSIHHFKKLMYQSSSTECMMASLYTVSALLVTAFYQQYLMFLTNTVQHKLNLLDMIPGV